jgi:hypothetical protein
MNIRKLVIWTAAVVASASAVLVGTAPAGAVTCSFAVPCPLGTGLPEGDVLGIWAAPNSVRAVFIHQESSGNQLYSSTVQGGQSPTRLNVQGATPAGFVAITPDSSRVVYSGPIVNGTVSIYTVPIAGPASASVRIATNVLAAPGAVQVSPDSRKLVYLPATRDRLQATPPAGPASAAARLTDPLVTGGSIAPDFRISTNSASVVYRANQDIAAATELYRVPLLLSPDPDPPTTKLNPPFPPGRAVGAFQLAPANGPVVYFADQDVDNLAELYSVRLGGAGAVKISAPIPANWRITPPGDSNPDEPIGRILADGSRVLYRIAQNQFVGQPEVRLLSAPIAGPASATLRIDLPPGGSAADARVSRYRPTANSARVVYTMVDDDDGTTGPTYYLLSVPAAGPASDSVVLSFPRTEDDLFTLNPNGQRVLWKLGTNLYSVPTDGNGQHIQLDGTEDPQAFPVLVNPIGGRAVYQAPAPGGEDLFSAPMSGTGTRFNLTDSLDPWDIGQLTLTADGVYAVFAVRRGSLDADIEPFSARLVPEP